MATQTISPVFMDGYGDLIQSPAPPVVEFTGPTYAIDTDLIVTEPILSQRIYDSVLDAWVYYAKFVSDPAPLAGETSPNHTGNLVASTHEVL